MNKKEELDLLLGICKNPDSIHNFGMRSDCPCPKCKDHISMDIPSSNLPNNKNLNYLFVEIVSEKND